MPLFERDRHSHVVPTRAILGSHPPFDDRDPGNREVKTNRCTKFREILFRRKKLASDISTAPPLISPVSTWLSNGSASQQKHSSFMSKYRKEKNDTKRIASIKQDLHVAVTTKTWRSAGDEHLVRKSGSQVWMGTWQWRIVGYCYYITSRGEQYASSKLKFLTDAVRKQEPGWKNIFPEKWWPWTGYRERQQRKIQVCKGICGRYSRCIWYRNERK